MKWCAADGTRFIRQIEAAGYGTVFKKFTVPARGAYIVRRQRVNFRYIRHGGDERRTDRAAGSHEIAVIVRMLYQFMRNIVKHAEPVAENRSKFFIQSGFNYSRQRGAVYFVGLIQTHLFQRFRRPFNSREIEVCFRYGRDSVNHGVNLIRVGNYDFSGPLFPQVGEFVNHFVSCAQI